MILFCSASFHDGWVNSEERAGCHKVKLINQNEFNLPWNLSLWYDGSGIDYALLLLKEQRIRNPHEPCDARRTSKHFAIKVYIY